MYAYNTRCTWLQWRICCKAINGQDERCTRGVWHTIIGRLYTKIRTEKLYEKSDLSDQKWRETLWNGPKITIYDTADGVRYYTRQWTQPVLKYLQDATTSARKSDKRWKRLSAMSSAVIGTRTGVTCVSPTTAGRPPELQGGHPRGRARLCRDSLARHRIRTYTPNLITTPIRVSLYYSDPKPSACKPILN